jgi:hypothetical protein
MPRKRQTIEQWIAEALSDPDKEKPCTAISLVHMGGNGISQKEIHTTALSGKTHEPKKLASLFQTKAENYAQDLGGIQTFNLLAFYGGEQEPQAFHPFKVIDGDISDGAMVMSETPDPRGLQAQLMKHLETKEKLLVGFIQEIVVTTLRDRTKLQEEVNDAYAVMREMLLKTATEHHDHRMKELEYARQSEERGQLLRLAPALVNGLTGREIIPQSTADTAMIEEIARRVKPEMLQELVKFGILPAELLGPLAARFNEVRERDRQAKEEVKRIPASNSDPAKDAQGN